MQEELVKQLPSAAAIIVVVFVFVRFLKEESGRRERSESARATALETMGDGCHEHARQLNERASAAIDGAGEAIKENTKALGTIAELMRGCADRANGKAKQ
jgi:hypothetical protein